MHYSLELIPPEKEERLKVWVEDIAPQVRDFFDILTIVDKTTRHEPVETAIALREHFQGTIIPHLTLRDRTRKEVADMIARARGAGITKFLALKGDTPPSGEFSDVCELITFLKEGGMEVGAALNPRVDSPERLQQKITAGATFFITQPVWNEKLSFPRKLSFENVEIIPTLLLADNKKLKKYALQYPEMGIPKSYLAQHAREGAVFATFYARSLKQKLEAQGVTWLHFMGDPELILSLF